MDENTQNHKVVEVRQINRKAPDGHPFKTTATYLTLTMKPLIPPEPIKRPQGHSKS